MNKQPFFIFFVLMILGIFCQEYFYQLDIYWLFLGVVAFLVFGFSFWFKSYKIRFFSFVIFSFFVGYFCHFFNKKENQFDLEEGKMVLEFKIDKKLNSNQKNYRYLIDVLHNGKKIPMVFSLPKNKGKLNYENIYRAKVELREIKSPQYDYQFDYKKYMQRMGVFYQAYFDEDLQFSYNQGLTFSEKIKQYRFSVMEKIENNSILSSVNQEFMKGIILSDRTDMEEGVLKDFHKTGLVHILAISGSHMVLIFAVVLFLCKIIGLPSRVRVIVSLSVIWAFSVLIDYGSSVVRASFMLSIYYIFVLLQRKPDVLHSLSLTGILMLMWDSQSLFDVGFQLSFLAVLGIYYLYQPILNLLPKIKNRVVYYFYAVLALSLSAQIFTLPLVIYYFNHISFTSFFANLVVIPLAEVVIIFSFFKVFMIMLGLEFGFLFELYHQVVEYFLKIVSFFAEISWVDDGVSLVFLEVVFLFFVIYRLRFFLLKRNFYRLLSFIFSIFLFLLVRFFVNFEIFNQNEVLVHFYQNKKIISIKKGNQACFYVFEKQDFERVNRYIIQPYSKSKRISEIKIFKYSEHSEFLSYQGKKWALR